MLSILNLNNYNLILFSSFAISSCCSRTKDNIRFEVFGSINCFF